MFNKQKRSKHLSLLCVVNALQKEKLGNHDYLEEIKLDLEESIPLSQKKVEYLKERLGQLKEKRKEAKPQISETITTNDKKGKKPQKQAEKRLPFNRFLGKKTKKEPKDVTNPELSIIEQKFDTDGQTKNSPQVTKQNLPKLLATHDLNGNQKVVDTQKNPSFFKFFGKRKKPQQRNQIHLSGAEPSFDDQKSDIGVKNSDDSKNTAGTAMTDENIIETVLDIDDGMSGTCETPEETERQIIDSGINKISTNDQVIESIKLNDSKLGGMRQVLNELNKEKEILRTDVEEVKQLDDIKQLLVELSKEKKELKTNVDEIKSRFSVKPLAEKYDKIERRLQSTTDNLYSIQSDIYERIKEIRILRKDLSIIKEDLDSL